MPEPDRVSGWAIRLHLEAPRRRPTLAVMLRDLGVAFGLVAAPSLSARQAAAAEWAVEMLAAELGEDDGE
jgi:hypothetical protein